MTTAYDHGADMDAATGEFDLEDRHALRRVAGLSTELTDITEVEYRALPLEGGARRVVGARRPDAARGRGRPRHLRRRGQGARARRDRGGDRRRHGDLRRR